MKKILNGYKRYIISNGLLNLDKIGSVSYTHLNPDTTFSDIANENTSVTSIMTSMSSPYVFCEMAETCLLYTSRCV